MERTINDWEQYLVEMLPDLPNESMEDYENQLGNLHWSIHKALQEINSLRTNTSLAEYLDNQETRVMGRIKNIIKSAAKEQKAVKPTIVEVSILPDGRMDTVEAAKYIGLTSKTLAVKRCKGTGPRFTKVGSKVFYFKHHVDEWLASLRSSNETHDSSEQSTPSSCEKHGGQTPCPICEAHTTDIPENVSKSVSKRLALQKKGQETKK